VIGSLNLTHPVSLPREERQAILAQVFCPPGRAHQFQKKLP